MKLGLCRKRRHQQRLLSQRSVSIVAAGDEGNNRYVYSAAVDTDEVIFCILDSLVDGKAETVAAATNTVLRFSLVQQDFTIRSILYFLEVQKTTEAHQHALLCLLRKCITQSHDTIPAGLMRDILLFILKELNFLNTSDLRHSVLVETLKDTAVLCPAFSVEVILAFIVGMRQEGACHTETLCIYIRVLSHIYDKASNNDYIKGVGVLGQIMLLYDGSTVSVESVELCKSMVSLLCTLSKAFHSIQPEIKTHVSCRDGISTKLFDALSLEDVSASRFSTWLERYCMYTSSVVKPCNERYETMTVQQLGSLIDCTSTSDSDVPWPCHSTDDSSDVTSTSKLVVRSCKLEGTKRAISTVVKRDDFSSSHMCNDREFVEVYSPLMSVEENAISSEDVSSTKVDMRSTRSGILQDVLDPLFPLLVDKSLSSMYTNPHYTDTCLELLFSLSLFSKHVSDSTLSRYGLTILDSIVVRFYHYLHGTPYRHVASQNHPNAWMTLHRESSDTYRNKLVTIFSSIGSYADKNSVLPPPSLVMCLLNFCKVLLARHAHLVLCQMPNICEVLFGLLVGLHLSGKASLLTVCDSSLASNPVVEDDLLLTHGSSGAYLNISCVSSCKTFVSTLVYACRFFMSTISTRTYFLDFLFRKSLSGSDKEMAVALFMLGWSCSHPSLSDSLLKAKSGMYSRLDFGLTCGLFWRLIETLSTIVSRISVDSTNPFALRLILTTINHLSRGNWLTFHCLAGCTRATNYHGGFYKEGSLLFVTRAVHSLLDFVFNIKVLYDIEERIAENTKFSHSKNITLGSKFFRYMYSGKQSWGHDICLLVSGSISYEKFLLTYSGDLMFMFLVNNLLSNSKTSALTTLRSLYRLFSWDTLSSLSARCSYTTFSRMLAFVLLYLHDHINYFGEAYASARLLPYVCGILFDQKFQLRGSWPKDSYSGLDAYLLSYESGDSYGYLSGMDHIILHFEKISELLHHISCSASFSTTALPVIDQLCKIAQCLKSPVTTYTSLLKIGKIQSSSSTTVYHSLGILHIIAAYSVCSVDLCSLLIDFLLGFKSTPSTAAFDKTFKVDDSLSHLVQSFGKRAALTLCIHDQVRYTMLQLRPLKSFKGDTAADKCLQDGRLFVNMPSDDILQQEVISLRGLILGMMSMSASHYLCVLWKVYYSLLTRLPNSGAMFTKFSSSAFSDDVKSIALIAMGYFYSYTPIGFMDERLLVGYPKPFHELESHISSQIEMLATINDESHLVEMYNCCFRVDHASKVSNDLSEDVGILRCIVTPMLYFCFHESDPVVQLSISRAFIIAFRSFKNRRIEGFSMSFPLIALKRMLYFLSNPILKEYASNQLYDTSALEQQYSHLFNNTRWDLGFSTLRAVEVEPLKPTADGVTCSNISLSYFSTTCLLAEFMSSDNSAFTTLQTVLSFGDYCQLHAKSHLHSKGSSSESINVEAFTVHMMSAFYYSHGWQRLSHIIAITLFLSENFPNELITYRVSLVVKFLGGVDFSKLPNHTVDHDEHMGFVDCVLLLWAHMLRLEAGSALREPLRQHLEAALPMCTEDASSAGVAADSPISCEVERIDLLLPKESLMISLLCCMKYVSASTCISGSFAVILQLILQQRYADLDHNHLESILATIFSNFYGAFERHDVPCSLSNFVIDLAQTDFVVLCNVIFSKSNNYKKSLTLSVAKLITSDPFLMVQLLDFLESCLLSEYDRNPGMRYNVTIDFILDFTEDLYLPSDANILRSDEGVRFLCTLALHFVYLSKTAAKQPVSVLTRFLRIVERLVSEGSLRLDNEDVGTNLTVSAAVSKNAKTSTNIITGNDSQILFDVGRSCRMLITSSDSHKLCFLRFVDEAVNRQNAVNPVLLRVSLHLFCSLLKEGAFTLHGGMVLCLIQKITLFKEFQKYYYKAIHYYLKRVELMPMGVYTRCLISSGFRSSRCNDAGSATLRKPSTMISVDMCNLKRCILDRLVISLLDDLVSSLSADILYCIERAASSLIAYVSTRWGCRVRNFNVLILRLLRNYSTLIRNEARILYAFSKLYLSIGRWLESCMRRHVVLPIEVQRHLLPPLGLLILHRSISIRCESTCRKLTRCLATIVGDNICHISVSSSSRSWLKAVLLRRAPGHVVPQQLCMCGCNNPVMSQFGDARFCICNGFYLLDLFSSCFPQSCWDIKLGDNVDIDEEIAKLKKDEHMKRTSQVLFGDGHESGPMHSMPLELSSSHSSTEAVAGGGEVFFDLSTVYHVGTGKDASLVPPNYSPCQMLTARSMQTCSFGNSSIPTLDGDQEKPHSDYKRAFSADTAISNSRGKLGAAATASGGTPLAQLCEEATSMPASDDPPAISDAGHIGSTSQLNRRSSDCCIMPASSAISATKAGDGNMVDAIYRTSPRHHKAKDTHHMTNAPVILEGHTMECKFDGGKSRYAPRGDAAGSIVKPNVNKPSIVVRSAATAYGDISGKCKKEIRVRNKYRGSLLDRKTRHRTNRRSMGNAFNTLPCLPSLLSLLTIADFQVGKDGHLRRINVSSSDRMDSAQSGEYNTEQRNVSFFDISSLDSVWNTTLYNSPAVYRFMLVRKYLTRQRLYPSIVADVGEGPEMPQSNFTVPEEVMVNAVRGVVAILHMSILHLSKEGVLLREYIDAHWPRCFIEMARYNAILHFESLAKAAAKQLCKMLETSSGRIKKVLLEAMEFFAIVRSSSLSAGKGTYPR